MIHAATLIKIYKEHCVTLEKLNFVDQVIFANKNLNGKPQKPFTTANILDKLETQTNFSYGNSTNQINLHNGQFLHQNNLAQINLLLDRQTQEVCINFSDENSQEWRKMKMLLLVGNPK